MAQYTKQQYPPQASIWPPSDNSSKSGSSWNWKCTPLNCNGPQECYPHNKESLLFCADATFLSLALHLSAFPRCFAWFGLHRPPSLLIRIRNRCKCSRTRYVWVFIRSFRNCPNRWLSFLTKLRWPYRFQTQTASQPNCTSQWNTQRCFSPSTTSFFPPIKSSKPLHTMCTLLSDPTCTCVSDTEKGWPFSCP